VDVNKDLKDIEIEDVEEEDRLANKSW